MSFTPIKTLLFLVTVMIVFIVFNQLMPRELGNEGFKLKFFKASKWFEEKEEIPVIEDIDAFLASRDSAVNTADTVVVLQQDSKSMEVSFERSQDITSLQFKDKNSSALFSFFEKLSQVKGSEQKLHILHYGDSQIESDRMTSVIREKLQSEFGGKGPGLICPVPITGSAAIGQKNSSNWKRYTAYGFSDDKSTHDDYGVMCSYARFTPAWSDEELALKDTTEAWLELKPSGMCSGNCKAYSQLSMLLGGNRREVEIRVVIEDTLFAEETLPASSGRNWIKYFLGSTPKNVKLYFRGIDSPDVQALLLEGWQGVQVDNIALRGSSGTIFRKIASTNFSRVIDELNTGLIILQFGGNSVPGLKDAQSAKNFGSYFKSQIKHIQSLHPDIPIVVIGPSDMSTSIDGEFQTWPYLEELNTAMRDAAWETGCGFWDMYAVMGGRNSMISWVNSNPPYAGTDYTHFTPKGARKMAELFYSALHREYELWNKAK